MDMAPQTIEKAHVGDESRRFAADRNSAGAAPAARALR
jgi:hypothetical protein